MLGQTVLNDDFFTQTSSYCSTIFYFILFLSSFTHNWKQASLDEDCHWKCMSNSSANIPVVIKLLQNFPIFSERWENIMNIIAHMKLTSSYFQFDSPHLCKVIKNVYNDKFWNARYNRYFMPDFIRHSNIFFLYFMQKYDHTFCEGTQGQVIMYKYFKSVDSLIIVL